MDVWKHKGEHEGQIYIKKYKRNCGRAECPVCYEAWASKEAHRAERRLRSFRPSHFRNVIHVIVSPPQADIDLDYQKLRERAYFTLKKVGIRGGICLFHPFRQREDGSWYLSPHFHVLCYGWVSRVGETYEETGYIVKNKGVRKSVYATLMYQLSHAGVYMKAEGQKGKKSTITWFGELSYNKFKAPKEELRDLCPICEAPLVVLTYVGVGDPPLNTLDVQETEGEWLIPHSFDWEKKQYCGE